MINWRVELSNGDVAEQGEMPWVELPGERLPWPRLCAHLEEHNLYITKFWILQNGEIVASKDDFDSCFVEYDVELDNILGGPTATTLLYTGFFYDDRVDHILVNTETGELFTHVSKDFIAMAPSPGYKK